MRADVAAPPGGDRGPVGAEVCGSARRVPDGGVLGAECRAPRVPPGDRRPVTGPPVSASGAERGECSPICRDGMRDVRVVVASTRCPPGARAGPYTSHRWICSPFRCTTHSRAVAGASRRNAIGRLPRGTRSQWPHSRHRHVVASGGMRPLPIIGDHELRGVVPSSSPLMRTTRPGTGAAPLVGNGVVPVGPLPNPHRVRVPTHRATEQRCAGGPARKSWGQPGGRPAPTPST